MRHRCFGAGPDGGMSGFGRAPGGIRAGAADSLSPGLSLATRPVRGPLCGRRRDRNHGPAARAAAGAAAGQAVRDRQPAGRRHRHRCQLRRQVGAGWPYHPARHQHDHGDQCQHLQQSRLRSGQGPDAGRAVLRHPVRPRGQSRAAGALGGGARGARQAHVRRARLCIERARWRRPSLRRAHEEHDRHRDDACSLQGTCARLQRRGRRPCTR